MHNIYYSTYYFQALANMLIDIDHLIQILKKVIFENCVCEVVIERYITTFNLFLGRNLSLNNDF